MAYFKADRKLLNHKFQGYKLSAHLLGVLKKEVTHPVRVVELENDKFSYQLIKAYALHNHLHFDPANSSSVYWFGDDGNVIKATLQAPDSISLQTVYLHLPPAVNGVDPSRTVNPTIVFLDDVMGVVCTGDNNSAFLFSRSNSERFQESWAILESFPVGDGRSPVMVMAGSLGSSRANILFAVLSEPGSGDPVALYQWCRVEFKTSDGVQTRDISIVCQFKSKSLASYSNFQDQSSNMGMELLFMNESTPLTGSAEAMEVVMNEGKEGLNCHPGLGYGREEEGNGDKDHHPGLGYGREKEEVYEWTQSDSDVTVMLDLPEDVSERDVVCTTEYNRVLVIGLTDGTTLLRGRLNHVIEPDVTTWSVHKDDGGRNKLEVILEKHVEGVVWKYLTEEDTGSKVTTSHQDMDELSTEELEDLKRKLINDRGLGEGPGLSEMMMTGGGGGDVSMMETAMEECDELEEDATMFIISEQGALRQKISLGGRQLVFTAPCLERNSRYFTLRHDVDAVVWLPRSSSSSSSSSLGTSQPRWTHAATFNALGYVQASKTERKFTVCSPNAKYAVISDLNHVFVYLQPPHSDGGEELNTATEYVHSMPTKTILGVVACDKDVVFVLTKNELTALKIPQNS